MLKAPALVGNASRNAIAYRGVGLAIDRFNFLAIDIMNAESTAYSYDPSLRMAYYPFVVGESITLVGGLQARNQARAIVSGSIDMLGDALLSNQAYGNAQLARSIVSWVLGCSGRLRATKRQVRVVGADAVQTEFISQDTVEFSLTIEECAGSLSTPFKPFTPFSSSKLQLELVRGDVFVRKMMTPSPSGDGRFSATFVLPVEPGTYKLKLHLADPGYAALTCTEL